MVDLNDTQRSVGSPRTTPSETYITVIHSDDPAYRPANSQELHEVKEAVISSIGGGTPSLLTPAGRSPQAIERKFKNLAERWENDTQFSSSVLEMATHPAYQQIIGMGPDAVPLILRRLSDRLDHWFWALKAITGEDPVAESSKGDLPAMAQAWIEWGQRQGYEF